MRRTALPYPYGSCNLTFMKLRRMSVVVFLIATLSMAGCKARNSKVSESTGSIAISIDLTKVPPPGLRNLRRSSSGN